MPDAATFFYHFKQPLTIAYKIIKDIKQILKSTFVLKNILHGALFRKVKTVMQ